MWPVSLTPGKPRDAVIDVFELINRTTLRWTHGTESNPAGYEIVWRPTISPF